MSMPLLFSAPGNPLLPTQEGPGSQRCSVQAKGRSGTCALWLQPPRRLYARLVQWTPTPALGWHKGSRGVAIAEKLLQSQGCRGGSAGARTGTGEVGRLPLHLPLASQSRDATSGKAANCPVHAWWLLTTARDVNRVSMPAWAPRSRPNPQGTGPGARPNSCSG